MAGSRSFGGNVPRERAYKTGQPRHFATAPEVAGQRQYGLVPVDGRMGEAIRFHQVDDKRGKAAHTVAGRDGSALALVELAGLGLQRTKPYGQRNKKGGETLSRRPTVLKKKQYQHLNY